MKTKIIILFGLGVLSIPAQNYIPDPTFGLNGQTITPVREDASFGLAMTLQPDGKPIITGGMYSMTYGSSAFMTYRFTQTGQLDMTFGDTGRVITKYNFYSVDEADAVAVQPDGKILVGGGGNSVTPGGLGPDYNFALVRYLPNGTLDTTFGGDGLTEVDLGTTVEQISSLLVLSNGDILAAGRVGIVKYKPNGLVDFSFGNGGWISHDYVIGSMVLQPDGKFVVVGYSWDNGTGNDFVIARYDANGVPDNLFGINGVARVDFGTIHDYASSLHLKANGNLLIIGNTILGDGKNKFAAAELLPNGMLNTSFGVAGKTVANSNQRENFTGSSVRLPGSGKVLIGGQSFPGGLYSTTQARIMMMDSTGLFNYNFNTTGFINATGIQSSSFYGMALQPDGKILACGSTDQTGYYVMQIWRYQPQQLPPPPPPPVTTGLFESAQNEGGFALFPSPANTFIYLQYTNTTTQVIDVDILDLNGRVVMKQQANVTGNLQIDVSAFENGIYFAKLNRTGAASPVLKFVVAK